MAYSGVRLGGVQAAGRVVADHGAGVGGDFVAGGAEQLVDGQPGDLAAEVPQREIDGGEHAVRQGRQVEALALLEAVPEHLAVERVLADEVRLDDALDGARVGDAEVVAADALVGGDGQEGLDGLVLVAGRGGVAVAVGVADGLRQVREAGDGDVGDLHGAAPSGERRVASGEGRGARGEL